MGSHEAKPVKKEQQTRRRPARPTRAKQPLPYPRWIPAVLLLLPLLFTLAVALSQRAAFLTLAETKGAILADTAARLIEEGDLSLVDGERLQGSAFGELFRLSAYEGGDTVTWGVYRLEGTQPLLSAGTAAEAPSQRLILRARSNGSAQSRSGSQITSISVIYRSGKPLGIMQIHVDGSAHAALLGRDLLLTLAALFLAISLTLLCHRLLGRVPALKEGEETPWDPKGRVSRAVVLSLLLALCLFIGAACVTLRTTAVTQREREELLLQTDVLDALRLGYAERSEQSRLTESLSFHRAGQHYTLSLLTSADREELLSGSKSDRRLGEAMERAARGGALLSSDGHLRALVPLADGSRVLMLSTPKASGLQLSLLWGLGLLTCLLPALGLALYGRKKPRFREEVLDREA